MKAKLAIFLLIFISNIVNSQIDNEFWFAAPDVSHIHTCGPNPPNNANGTPISLYITAEQATNVRIEMPASGGSFTPIEFSLMAGEHRKVDLVPPMAPSVFENLTQAWPLPVGEEVQKKGILITSDPGNITAYYELNNECNRDIFALKGKNALGKDFYVSTQNFFPNGNYGSTAYSGFVIVATEDGTEVEITRNGVWQNFPTPPPETITITLNKGESFAFIANSTAPANHINGVRVHSLNYDIAITWYDDSIRKRWNAGSYSYDICGDQLIPMDLIGANYIVMKGEIYAGGSDGGERFFVTATEDGTDVYVDGAFRTTLDAGEVYSEEVNNTIEQVSCTAPVYVNHTSGTGGGGEMGGATLPTIDGCTGSHKVTFTRTNVSGDNFLLNLMVRNDTTTGSPLKNKSIQNFSIIIGPDTVSIPPTYFNFVPDSTWAYLRNDATTKAFITRAAPAPALITPGTTATVYNPISRFHLGVQNGGTSNGGKYGYFSDYSSNRGRAGIGGPKAPQKATYCNLDPVLFAVEGGLLYKWFGAVDADDTIYLSNTTQSEVYFSPPNAGLYKFGVDIIRECYADTIIYIQARSILGPVADFDILNPVGCSPFDPTFTNKTNFSLADKMLWNFNAGVDFNDTISQAFLTNPFNHTFPDNDSDTIQRYLVRLTAWAEFGECPTSREKYITIKPGAEALFDIDTASGCSPILVNFDNQSTGDLDTNSFYWQFGDGTQSTDSVPSHIYFNTIDEDTTYLAQLIVTTPLNCTDTAEQNIVVHPNVKAKLALDTALFCSPMNYNLKVGTSSGVDTFHWHIDYFDRIEEFKTENYNPLPISHSDTSLAFPDTVKINLIAENSMGCRDTFPQQKIIVIPEVEAEFDVDETEICDSARILFTNESSGYKMKYEFDFGDGITLIDPVITNHYHRYFNRLIPYSDRTYTATLTAISDNLCTETKDTAILVHPYVNAQFAVDYANNCAPLDAEITNLSINVDSYEWNFGDGSPIDNSSSPTISHQFWNPLTSQDTTYILKLRASSLEGCVDSIQRNILIYPQVVANFDMNIDEGCNPLKIIFQNNSTGSNLMYNWEYGKTVTGSETASTFERTFKHYKPYDSTFSVVLTTVNSQGCDSSISKPVTIYSYIDANFVVAKNDSCSPFPIDITNLSPLGGTFFNWNFGDGSPVSSIFEPSHTYTNTGLNKRTDTLRLIVKNNHTCYDTLKRAISVYPEVNAGFTIDKVQGCQPLTVSFANNTNIIPGTDFYWSFDDGTYSTNTTPMPHKFKNYTTSTITPTIRLNATSQYGCTDSTSQSIDVYPYIFAKFAIDKAYVCSDDIFQIDRTGSQGGIDQYLWDFDNNGTTDATTSDPIFDHQFTNTSASSDNITIKLTVTNSEGCDTSWTQNMVVNPEVVANFEIDDYAPCYPYSSILHNTTEYRGIVATKFVWNFGDGSVSISNDEFIEYKFLNVSNQNDEPYTVTLIAESEYECKDTVERAITIHPKPNAEFNFPVTIDCPPFSVPFENLSVGTNLTYEWDFGDGSPPANDTDPTHVFDNDTYAIQENDIRLISTTNFGCEDTVVKPILVYPKVNVDFEASQWQGCSPLVVDFDGSAINHNMVTWYIDDEAFSTIEKPSYRFVNNTADNLVVDIRFNARSIYGCSDDTIKQITIYTRPSVEFDPSPIIQDFNTATDITPVNLTNYTLHQASGTWEYLWDYGDGTSDSNTDQTFTKEYTIWGDINNKSKIPITLTAWNKDHSECSDTITREITIRPPIPEVDIAEDVAACSPFTVQFNSTTKYIYDDSYQWEFGYNGQTATGPDPEFTFTEPGVYIVKLIVEGDGGENWDYKKVTVYESPTIDFLFSPELVMVSSKTEIATPVKFFNNTQMGAEYLWDFGDDDISNEEEPTHIYDETGEYYVKLQAISAEGCMDTMTHPTPVIVEGTRKLEFPTAFVVNPDIPADENYNPSDPNVHIFRPIAEGVENYKLEIYNRWGELIFSTTDVYQGWNGYVKGKLMKQDVYIWRVSATFTDGKPIVRAGDVTLIISPK